MGTVRIEIVRLGNKHTLNPGQIDRRNPRPVQVISVTTNSSTDTASTAVAAQAGFQDLYARIVPSQSVYVNVSPGAASTGFQITATGAGGPVLLPVRAGDIINARDLA